MHLNLYKNREILLLLKAPGSKFKDPWTKLINQGILVYQV